MPLKSTSIPVSADIYRTCLLQTSSMSYVYIYVSVRPLHQEIHFCSFAPYFYIDISFLVMELKLCRLIVFRLAVELYHVQFTSMVQN